MLAYKSNKNIKSFLVRSKLPPSLDCINKTLTMYHLNTHLYQITNWRIDRVGSIHNHYLIINHYSYYCTLIHKTIIIIILFVNHLSPYNAQYMNHSKQPDSSIRRSTTLRLSRSLSLSPPPLSFSIFFTVRHDISLFFRPLTCATPFIIRMPIIPT